MTYKGLKAILRFFKFFCIVSLLFFTKELYELTMQNLLPGSDVCINDLENLGGKISLKNRQHSNITWIADLMIRRVSLKIPLQVYHKQ